MVVGSVNMLDALAYSTSTLDAMTNAARPDLTQSIEVQRSERRLGLGLPFWVRGMNAEGLGDLWTGFCQTLADSGVLAQIPLEDLADLPTNAIPARMAVRYRDTSLNATEFDTADVIVLSRQDAQSSHWARQAEVFGGDSANAANDLTPTRLAGFVRAVRIAAGGDTPVGLSLPVSSADNDVVEAIEAECDFLLLEESVRTDGVDVSPETCLGVANVRRILEAREQMSLPVVLSAKVSRIDDAVKLLALGADLVSVDALLQEVLPEEDEKQVKESAGRLSSLVAMPAEDRSSRSKMQPIADRIEDLKSGLEAAMNRTGAATLQEFDASKLVAFDPHAAAVCDVRGLESPNE